MINLIIHCQLSSLFLTRLSLDEFLDPEHHLEDKCTDQFVPGTKRRCIHCHFETLSQLWDVLPEIVVAEILNRDSLVPRHPFAQRIAHLLFLHHRVEEAHEGNFQRLPSLGAQVLVQHIRLVPGERQRNCETVEEGLIGEARVLRHLGC